MTIRANSAAARDVAHHLHPYTNLKSLEETGPMVVTEGRGVRVFDENGKDYIEGLAGLWCTALGWGEERLVAAAEKAMRRLPFYHSFGGKVPEATVDLAEKLLSMAPGEMGKVFFANSGSEANDTAIKIIWYYNNALGRPEKKKIISRIKGYHGVTVASASLTGLPNNHRAFDLPIDRIMHTSCPHHYRFGHEGESEEDFATRCAEDLDRMIEDEGPDTVAAFFAEPVMGAGGVIVPPATYFDKVQAVLKKHDVLLLADEVICGFGRTGNLWGCETFGIKPDMMATAKALSSAYLPISALMVSDEIYRTVRDQSAEIGLFGHGFTYGGHPVSAAVALETLKIYEERDIVSQIQAVAPVLQDGLRRLGGHPLVGEARGVGLIGALELVKDKATKEAFAPAEGVGAHVAGRLQAHGVITRVIVDSIAFAPPLVISADEINDMLGRVEKALDDTAAWLADRT
ncbi:MAG: aspartate aminotransferase family protein [Hyphomicrobiales bacterium]|nr:aspartate aminotransferase family protein [Hyphomicrobiales bacterium]MCP5373890.1 aspartate aminotransferase family protein [Hyphomicrobiales bacterium]